MKKFILLIFILTSCGPNANLRLAQRLIRKAQMQGAVLRNDTIYVDKKIEVKGDSTIITLTKVLPGKVRDTIIYRDRIKIQIHWKHDTLEVAAKCPDSVLNVKTPTAIKQTIECPPPNHTWRTVALTVLGIFLLLLIAFFVVMNNKIFNP